MRLRLDEATRVSTAYLFALTSLLVLVGAAVVLMASRAPARVRLKSLHTGQRRSVALLILSLAPLMLIANSLGSTLISRDVYLAGEGGSNFFALGQQLAIASVAVAGNVVASKRGFPRLLAWLIALAYVVLFFSLGSRRLALAPLAFALGFVMARPRSSAKALLLGALAAIPLLPLPLYLRGLGRHGLNPYFIALTSYDFASVDWAQTVNNVLIAFPISGITAFASNPIPLRNLLISVNPSPGFLAGWYEISASMALNRWTPFSAIGEGGNYGGVWLAAIWFSIGLLLGWLEIRMASFIRRGQSIIAIAIVGLVSLFAVQAIQYSLRASTRLLVYAVVIVMATKLYYRMSGGSESKMISGS